MNPLYFLEHKELPRIIYSEELSKDGTGWIVNQFEEICVHILKTAFGYTPYKMEDFKLSVVRVKNGDKTVYLIACFEFPFIKRHDFNMLCPRAYLVCEDDYGRKPYYYTVEYDDSLSFDDEGTFFLCGWCPDEDGNLNHPNYGTVKAGRESELLRIKKMTNKRMGIDDLGL